MRISWRSFEWWGCGTALFFQTGAIFPLMTDSLLGPLGQNATALLRLLSLVPYAITLVLLAKHSASLLLVLRRNLLFSALLMLPILSVLWSVSPAVSFRRAIGLVLSMAIAYVIALRFTPRQTLALVGAVLLPCMVASLGLAVLAPHLAWMPDGPELRGVFVHKNVLGWYSAAAILVSGFMILDGPSVLRRVGCLALVPSVACLLASTSMTGILAAMAVLVITPFYLVLPLVKGPSRLLLVLLVTEAAMLLMFGLQAYLVPALEALGKDPTLTGRVPLWELADGYIARQPLLGYGYKAFWNSPPAWQIWSAIGWNAPHAHNGYREMLLSCGLVGLAPLLLVLAGALRQGAALHCAAPRDGWIWLNVLIVMLIVMNLTECLFMEQNNFFFILCGAAIVMFGLYSPELGRVHSSALRSPVRWRVRLREGGL